MLPKKRSIKKLDEGNESKKKKKKVDETPSSVEQKSKRSKEKLPCAENSSINTPILFVHSNASVKVLLILISI
jgi:hypothetical protein